MHPPNYPENHQNFVPPNTHGLPSELVHGGHAPNGATMAHTQHDRSVSSSNPYTAHAAHALPPQGPSPPTQNSSNVTPVFGADTFRRNASVSPEKGSADVSSTPQAASSLKVHDINTATNAFTLEDAVAMSEQARASATIEGVHAPPKSSIHTPKAKESPIPAPATKPRPPQHPPSSGNYHHPLRILAANHENTTLILIPSTVSTRERPQNQIPEQTSPPAHHRTSKWTLRAHTMTT